MWIYLTPHITLPESVHMAIAHMLKIKTYVEIGLWTEPVTHKQG